MKSVIKYPEVQEESKYPCLKIYNAVGEEDFHKVVLFTEEGIGTVVYPIGGNTVLGQTCEWCEEKFEPFHGTIELSNK